MPTLQLRFPAGRYHATAWGHHVNEGQVEWPPSPWRVLRALVACGFNTQRWQEIPPTARRMLETLAAVLPSYRLPEASGAHSRHFMPIGQLAKGRERTTLVFDTWANVDEPLFVRWDCELAADETQELQTLAESLGYLGRSESWVEAALVADSKVSMAEFNAVPHRPGMRLEPRQEQVSLVAPIPPEEYLAWRQATTKGLLAGVPLPEGRKPPAKVLKERARIVAPYPKDLLDCATMDTAWWKGHRWSQPPGSQRVVYWRPSDPLAVGVPMRPRPRAVRPVTTMLLALSTSSGNQSALPPCHRALPQAELLHRALVGRAANGQRIHCPELTGRDEQGRPLQNNHRHAHILPVDLDADGHLDHIIVHAEMMLGEAAQHAIRSIGRTWTKGGVGDLQVALAGSGDLEMLRSLPAQLRPQVERLLGPRSGSRMWVSITPFVPPRFLKRRGPNALEEQVAAELTSRGLPVAEVEVLPWSCVQARSMRHFIRVRRRVPPPVDTGFCLKLYFSQPVHANRTPLALGYGSHFGLGMFAAQTEKGQS